MKSLLESEKFIITHTLSDGEIDLSIRCKVFDKELNDITNDTFGSLYVELSHISLGMYGYVHTQGLPTGIYLIVFQIFADNTYMDLSEKYGIIEESIRVSNIVEDVVTAVNPSNILRDNDPRLDLLQQILDKMANETTLVNLSQNVIDQIKDELDNADGGAI